jgi:thiol-disulfide isomerase/thioredoxin
MVQISATGNLMLPELEEKESFKPTDDPEFFAEWCEALPELSDEEKRYLDQVQQEYFDQTRNGQISEGFLVSARVGNDDGFENYSVAR